MVKDPVYANESAVRAKAYELWMQRGCPQNSPEQDWYEAVRLLSTAPPPVAADHQGRPVPDSEPPTARITRRRG